MRRIAVILMLLCATALAAQSYIYDEFRAFKGMLNGKTAFEEYQPDGEMTGKIDLEYYEVEGDYTLKKSHVDQPQQRPTASPTSISSLVSRVMPRVPTQPMCGIPPRYSSTVSTPSTR